MAVNLRPPYPSRLGGKTSSPWRTAPRCGGAAFLQQLPLQPT
jgi:hypothetical protein